MRQGEPLVTFGPRGRLGNVMFQAAACIGYGKRHNVPWGIPRNTKEVPRFHEFFPGLPVCDSHYRGYQEHPDDAFCQLHQTTRGKCHFNYHPIPFHPTGVRLEGFWQSWKYFEGADEEIKKAFRLKQYPELKDYVSIHVRRGDYVNYSGSFPPVTQDYIFQALKQFTFSTFRKVIVFSDDIKWCKDMFGDGAYVSGNGYEPFTIEYAEGNDEITDLSMMASCAHNIIANSTFSWWAAYLNKNPDKIVVSPSHKRGNWFGLKCGVQTDVIDLLPLSWHQIEFR